MFLIASELESIWIFAIRCIFMDYYISYTETSSSKVQAQEIKQDIRDSKKSELVYDTLAPSCSPKRIVEIIPVSKKFNISFGIYS